MADHILVAGRRGEDVEARGRRRRSGGAVGFVCGAAGKGAGEDGPQLSDYRPPGGGSRWVLDPPRLGEGRDRKPCGRPGLDHDFAAEETSQDGPHRRRGAGADAPGLQARRAAGLLDGQAAESRRGRSPAAGARTQGADHRARPPQQPDQGAAVRARDQQVRAAAPGPTSAACGAALCQLVAEISRDARATAASCRLT